MAHNRRQWWTVVITAINLRVNIMWRIVLTRQVTGSFSRRTQFQIEDIFDQLIYIQSLKAGRPRVRSSNPGRVKSFLHVIQPGSVALPTSCTKGTGDSFPGGKAAGA
jgi:hypothetical protein